jgi:hypothetical protein
MPFVNSKVGRAICPGWRTTVRFALRVGLAFMKGTIISTII